MDWLPFDIGHYRWLVGAGMFGVLVAAYFVARLLKKLVLVLLTFAVATVVVVALALQISALTDCHRTCTCTVFTRSIDLTDVAGDWGCGEGRIQLNLPG